MSDITIKIFFDERVLILAPKDTIISASDKITWNGDRQWLAHRLATFAASDDKMLCLCHAEVDALLEAVKPCFKVVEAAGGVVNLPDGRILLIKRLGKWDLPKGKAEKGELPEQTAVREVMEECGLSETPVIASKLTDSYHTYHHKGHHVLKHTAWYAMDYAAAEPLQPQLSEDITEAVWCTRQQVDAAMLQTYGSVKDVLAAYLTGGR
ncbi:MAG: NUDIX domain-containing protein [Bacteroidales bacterium]|jgi:ADP-ribose pyrophosphatase YjhB (NUDIX family)|nr:NUDIX domain-containing protein [Bacteroidales bacterium]